MADLGFNFNPNAVEPGQDFDTLPAGQYLAMIVESDVVDTKSGSGKMLKLVWQVVSGQFENRKIWQNLNIVNDSEKAQTIAHQQLKAICDAIGVGGISDSSDLHDQICIVTVKVKQDQQYGPKNEIGSVKPFQSAHGQGTMNAYRPAPSSQRDAPPPAQPAASASRAAGSGARPWR